MYFQVITSVINHELVHFVDKQASDDLITFFKCFFGLWIQPAIPHFCCSLIDGVWARRKLALGVVVMVTQSRVHLSI